MPNKTICMYMSDSAFCTLQTHFRQWLDVLTRDVCVSYAVCALTQDTVVAGGVCVSGNYCGFVMEHLDINVTCDYADLFSNVVLRFCIWLFAVFYKVLSFFEKSSYCKAKRLSSGINKGFWILAFVTSENIFITLNMQFSCVEIQF